MSLKTNEKNRIFPIVGYAAIIALAILWASTAFAATVELSYQCPDGRYVVDTGTPDCPVRTTGVQFGANLSSTTTDIKATLNETGDADYWCVYLATSTTPSWDQLVAGTDGDDVSCVDSGDGSADSTAFTANVTGLTASTSYKYAYGVLKNGKRSVVTASSAATTLSGGGGGGEDLTGLVKVVDSNVSGGAGTGLTVADAWDTIADVNANVSAVGEDVCLMAGSVFDDEQIDIDWGGASDDQAIVGTCYTSGGALYWWWEGPTPRATTRAEINGTLETACRNADPMSCQIDTASAVPSSRYAGLVKIAASEYVTVRGLSIQDSAGMGIQASGNGIGGDQDGLEIIQNEIGYSAFQAITLQRGARQAIVIDNHAHDFAECERAEKEGRGITYPVGNCGGSGQPAGVYVADHSGKDISGDGRSHSIVALNRFEDGSGEVLNLSGVRGWYVTQNVLGGGGATIYLGGDLNLVTKNIVLGNPDGSPPDNGQQGVMVHLEALLREDILIEGENLIHNNLMVGTSWGCAGGNVQSYALNHLMGMYCAMNTILGPESSSVRMAGGSSNWAGMRITGNLFGSMGVTPCIPYDSKITPTENAWDSAPVTSCADAGDYTGSLGMPLSDAAYQTIEISDIDGTFDFADYTPTNGTEIVSSFSFSVGIADIMDDTEWSAPLARLAEIIAEGTVNTNHWPSCTGAFDASPVSEDITCASRGAAPFDAGAIEQ